MATRDRLLTMKKPQLNPNDMRTYPVQQSPCYSCPFAGEKPLEISSENMNGYLNNLFGHGQHICHSTQQHICRGGRDLQLRWLCAIGLLDESTDEAFDRAVDESLA